MKDFTCFGGFLLRNQIFILCFLFLSCKAVKEDPQSSLSQASSGWSIYNFVDAAVCNTKKSKIHSVDALLKRLPDDMFKTFALIPNRASLCSDDISKTNPRVALIDEDSGFVVTYTTNPDGECYNKVEFLQVSKHLANSKKYPSFETALREAGEYAFFAPSVSILPRIGYHSDSTNAIKRDG